MIPEMDKMMNIHEAIEEIDNMVDRFEKRGIRLKYSEIEALYVLETIATTNKDYLKEVLKEIIEEG